jgi:hypothetical protein
MSPAEPSAGDTQGAAAGRGGPGAHMPAAAHTPCASASVGHRKQALDCKQLRMDNTWWAVER